MRLVGLLLLVPLGILGSVPQPVTLRELTEQAAQINELVAPGTSDEIRPLFDQFYKSQQPSLLKKLLQTCCIAKPLSYDTDRIRSLLRELITQKELNGYSGDFVVQIPWQAGDKIIVFGDLQGGFSSLVRSLRYFKQEGMIDEQLRLQDPHTTLIFNANAIGRTPYNLELLETIVSLQLQNPGKVWYIRGPYEEADFWVKYQLRQQLYALGEDDVADRYSLLNLIQRFFSTLPLALYINYDQGASLLRISGYARENFLLNERMCSDFFAQVPQEAPTIYYLNDRLQAQAPVHVRVLLHGLKNLEAFKVTTGLSLDEFTGGAISWTSFSSPTRVHQLVNRFYHDAFVIISLGKTIHTTPITLYNRDSRYRETFHMVARYSLASGRALGATEKLEAESRDQIILASTNDLSKGAAAVGRGLTTGVDVAVKEYNSQGGVHGRQIKYIKRDDGYDPARARANMDAFMTTDRVNFVLISNGAPNLRASLDLIEKGNVLLLFPSTGAPRFRSDRYPGVLHLRASLAEEVYALLPYMIEKKFVRRFAFFYQNDEFGLASLETARKILPYYGITEWTEIPYIRNMTDVDFLAQKIKEAQPEALGLFSISSVTRELFHALGATVLLSMKIFGNDALVDGVFDQYVRKLGIPCTLCRVVPDPATSNLPIVQEYRRAMDEAGLAYNDFSLEGYMGASLLIHALREIKGPLTIESVRTYFEQMRNYHFKGLVLTFTPQTRELQHAVWLDEGNGKIISVPNAEADFWKKFGKKKEEKLS